MKAVYNFYDFQLSKIQQLKNIVFRTLDDIPSMNDVKIPIENTNNNKLRAIIPFCVSSGCARKEMLSLTAGEFVYVTSNYHNSYDI